ncbi:MAG: hypothetical protein M3P98_04275 [bacterium]|nr:hypothetical protein [bacterium]
MAITTKVIQQSVQDKKLDLSNKELTNGDIKVICSFLNENPQITSLDVSYNQIGAEGAKALAANTSLTSLDVSVNQIGAEGAKALAANTSLTSLDVRYNKISDGGAKALAANRIVLGNAIYGQKKNQSTTSISMMVCDLPTKTRN